MYYPGIDFQTSISIKTIYSIHYYEYRTDFTFSGETHDFWEFVYADKGETIITSDQTEFRLKAGELYFHKPNEFHNVNVTGHIAPNLVVISFECHDDAMYFFNDRILRIDETERNLLADIIIEARRCFDCRLDDPYLQNMPLKDSDVFGAQQMIKLYLQHFLIHLIRRYSNPVVLPKKL